MLGFYLLLCLVAFTTLLHLNLKLVLMNFCQFLYQVYVCCTIHLEYIHAKIELVKQKSQTYRHTSAVIRNGSSMFMQKANLKISLSYNCYKVTQTEVFVPSLPNTSNWTNKATQTEAFVPSLPNTSNWTNKATQTEAFVPSLPNTSNRTKNQMDMETDHVWINIQSSFLHTAFPWVNFNLII